MDNLSKKTVILLQIVVIVFIAILIKNLCVNSNTTTQKDGFDNHCIDSCISNRSSTAPGCYINAPTGCPKKTSSFLTRNSRQGGKCIQDINQIDRNNPLECERRKYTYIKNCSVNPKRPENIKTYFYKNGSLTALKRELESIASNANKIIFFSKPNYQGEVFSIDIPSRRTKGYFNKKEQRFTIYDALSKPPDFLIDSICVKSVIIPDNEKPDDANFRNIKLVLKKNDETESENENNIKVTESNHTISGDHVTYYEVSPLLDTLDTYTATQVLEHNKQKINNLDIALDKNIEDLAQSSADKHQKQQQTIEDMASRVNKNVDKIIGNIGYKLVNGQL